VQVITISLHNPGGLDMNGEHLAWVVTHLNELFESALLGSTMLPLLIVAGSEWRQRRIANASLRA
jgi:hypothetical protein